MAKSVKKKKTVQNQGRTPYEKDLYDRLTDKWHRSGSISEEACWWKDAKMRTRTVKAAVSLTGEAAERFGLDEVTAEKTFGAAVCTQSEVHSPPETYGLNAAMALWIRDCIERKHNKENLEKLIEIENSRTLDNLRREPCNVQFYDTAHDSGPEDVDKIATIVTNRLSDDYWRYDLDDKRRKGPTWDLYQQLLDMIDGKHIDNVLKTYNDQFWAYAKTAVKIARKFDAVQVTQDTPVIMAMPSYMDGDGTERIMTPKLREDAKTASLMYLPIYLINRGSPMDGAMKRVMQTAGIEITDDDIRVCGADADPFSVSAGYILETDRNGATAFANGISRSLILLCSSLYPWSLPNRVAEGGKLRKPSECIKKSTTGYARNIAFTPDNSDTELYMSEAQMLYVGAGFIAMPRHIEQCRGQYKGMTHEMSGVYITLNMIRDIQNMYDEIGQRMCREKRQEELAAAEAAAKAGSEREIERLKSELDDAKARINDIDRDLTAARQELSEKEKENEEERAELYDLREIVYRSLEEDVPEEEDGTDDENRFPCETKNKIVIYGGHDTWRNGIRSKLPNVTLAPTSEAANLQLVRNADVLWIQTNSISHPLYHSVYDCAKNAGVPVRLFTSAGVISCAEQIIRSERA